MYADTITDSMKQTIEETSRRREKQIKYNEENGIVPRQIMKGKANIFEQRGVLDKRKKSPYIEDLETTINIAADPVVEYMSKEQMLKAIQNTKSKMEQAAKNMEFMEAARLRDEMLGMKKRFEEKFGGEG
jgi:excinuclease ABC subunit B